jgi:non-ribosomal peptide synthase protein (TIGR01720 family)
LAQFSLEETTSLLHAVSKAYRATVEEVLLTCLAQAFARWTKAPAVLIDQETTARKSVTGEIELSRTIGCFKHVFPALLDLGGAENAGDALTNVKECLRRIPHQGINYGLLYYSEGDTAPGESLRAQPCAEVSFKYTPGFEQIRSASSWFHQSAQSGGTNDAQQNRRYLLEVRAAVVGERLEMCWTYSENIHARSKIEDLANDFSQALRAFIAQSRSPESKPCLPSDFPLAKLDARKLSKVVALIEKIGRSQTSSQPGQ